MGKEESQHGKPTNLDAGGTPGVLVVPSHAEHRSISCCRSPGTVGTTLLLGEVENHEDNVSRGGG